MTSQSNLAYKIYNIETHEHMEDKNANSFVVSDLLTVQYGWSWSYLFTHASFGVKVMFIDFIFQMQPYKYIFIYAEIRHAFACYVSSK